MSKYKYDEIGILKQIQEHIDNTYKSHYVNEKDNVQLMDLFFAMGDGEAFCRTNTMKYVGRYGKKEGKNTRDLLKAIHCIMLMIYLQQKEENEAHPSKQ